MHFWELFFRRGSALREYAKARSLGRNNSTLPLGLLGDVRLPRLVGSRSCDREGLSPSPHPSPGLSVHPLPGARREWLVAESHGLVNERVSHHRVVLGGRCAQGCSNIAHRRLGRYRSIGRIKACTDPRMRDRIG